MSNPRLTGRDAAAVAIAGIVGIVVIVCYGLHMGHNGAMIAGGLATIAGLGGGIPIGIKLRDLLLK